MIPFCNYCKCDDCKNGEENLEHALTEYNDYICDTCYVYEVCQKFPEGKGNPCDANDPNCTHRPKLLSGWATFKIIQ